MEKNMFRPKLLGLIVQKSEGDTMKIYKRGQAGYPERLMPLPGMPEELYVEGKLPRDDRPSIAIVGARNCSSYGKNMAYEYAKFLARAGVQVISGLARGIDSAAHEGALAGANSANQYNANQYSANQYNTQSNLTVGGCASPGYAAHECSLSNTTRNNTDIASTFAVLGCGIDICYPASNRKLFEKIKQQGGLLSEFPLGSPPLAYHFPQRNRIISALADAVLVIEAKEKSGSLITADLALEQGRTVFALPGRVGDLLSTGCNRLIYQGAVPAWSPEMILEEMHWPVIKVKNDSQETNKHRASETTNSAHFAKNEKENRAMGLASEDFLVYSCLNFHPKSVTELQEETALSSGELMKSLIRLQIEGFAKEVWKNNFIRQEE